MQKLLFLWISLLSVLACNTTKPCEERQRPDCICTEQYEPVCGCNGKTYGNACLAQCAGITRFTPGECPDQKPASNLSGNTWKLQTFATGAKPEALPQDVQITAIFADGRISGIGGCNHYGGAYAAGDKNILSVSELTSTKMFCEKGMPWETRYFQMLEKSRAYRINGNKLEIDCGDLGGLVFEKG